MIQERRALTPDNLKMAMEELVSTPLGKTLVNFISPATQEQSIENRRAFARELVKLLESDNHNDKVEAIETLLQALDAKITTVDRIARVAREAADRAAGEAYSLAVEQHLGSLF